MKGRQNEEDGPRRSADSRLFLLLLLDFLSLISLHHHRWLLSGDAGSVTSGVVSRDGTIFPGKQQHALLSLQFQHLVNKLQERAS